MKSMWMAVLLMWCLAVPAHTATPQPLTFERLERDTARLEATRSVRHLQRAWGFYIDRALWNEAADLFATDATLELDGDGVYVGRDRIRQYLLQRGGGQQGLRWGQLAEYIQLQPVIHVAADGRTAQARWRDLALLGQWQQWARWGEGLYENTYVRRDGVWQIQSMRRHQRFEVPFDKGWMRVAAAPPPRSTTVTLAPDRPPSIAYQSFPAVDVPAFHYTRDQLGLVDGQVADGASADEAVVQAQALRLADRDAIENLQAGWGYYMDRHQWDDVAALFAANGRFEYGQRGVYIGARRIRQALMLLGPAGPQPGWLNNHLQLQPVIHVAADGRRAWGRWEGIQQLGEPGTAGAWGLGVYENEYVKQGNTWRIASLHFWQTALADYDLMWTRGPIPAVGPSAVLPPDLPPTVRYRSLPGVSLPPFHYPHPVTGKPIVTWPAPADSVLGIAGASTAVLPPWQPFPQDKLSSQAPVALQALARRLQALQDADEVETLQRSYGYFVDKGLWTELHDLYADDGTYEIGGRGVFIGKPRVLEYLRTGMGTERPVEGRLINHMQFQPIVSVDPDGRGASLRMKALVMSNGGWGDVIYENRYVKQDGVWKIASIRAPFVMYTSLEGWAKSATPNTRPESFAPPPDRLPTTVYLTYPSPHIVPFHYPNPVSGRRFVAPQESR